MMTESPPTHPPPPSTPFNYLMKCVATLIDTCVLLLWGCKRVGGVQTHGYPGYHGFCMTPHITGAECAGTGAALDFLTHKLLMSNPTQLSFRPRSSCLCMCYYNSLNLESAKGKIPFQFQYPYPDLPLGCVPQFLHLWLTTKWGQVYVRVVSLLLVSSCL
jgi:hypothetical protein